MTVPSAWAAAPHHIALHVSDLDASELFYARFLGARRISARSAEEPYIGTLTGHPNAQIRSVMLNLPGTTVALELLAYSGIERAPSNAERLNPAPPTLASSSMMSTPSTAHGGRPESEPSRRP
jgi:catechol 2,3-dioxygenase-like lactoylglutathione lyase family enzyme